MHSNSKQVMMGNSNRTDACRELLVGAKQWQKAAKLSLEPSAEPLDAVGWNGCPPLSGGHMKRVRREYFLMSCRALREQVEWYRGKQSMPPPLKKRRRLF